MSGNKLVKTLRTFFPQEGYTEEVASKGLDNGDIVVNPGIIINYLQSALLDESLLEVELGNLTRVFYCRILDHPPEEEPVAELNDSGEADGDVETSTSEEEIPYSKGDYLNEADYLILTPLEPAEGNYLVNSSPRTLVRALTSQAAIEFCCYFEEKTKVDGMPVLRLSFPGVARQVKGAREYRVKVPADMDLKIIVTQKKTKLKFTTRPMDMSMHGMSLYDPKGKDSTLKTDDKVSFQIVSEDMILLTLDAVIRHVTRLRDSKGLQYVFGVQLDLKSRTVASQVEKLVSSIQRARLRELVEIEDEYGVSLSDW